MLSEASAPEKLTFCFQVGFFMLSNRRGMGKGGRRSMTLWADAEFVPEVLDGNVV